MISQQITEPDTYHSSDELCSVRDKVNHFRKKNRIEFSRSGCDRSQRVTTLYLIDLICCKN